MLLDSNILIGLLALLVLVLSIDLGCLRWKIRKTLRNKQNIDISSTIMSLDKDVKDLDKFRSEMESYLKNVENRLSRSSQAVETVRFNAFRGDGIGGNQSFATAIINENGDGAVISSIYSRERVSVFSKGIMKFNSEIELSEEEKRAVKMAQSKLAKSR